MSLLAGAETVVDECLDVQEDEYVVVVHDGNDLNIIDALLTTLEGRAEYDYLEYEPPERHGGEPPERVAERLREADVFIAPTGKSISHTAARRAATDAGARGVTMPGITQEIWSNALVADYEEISRLCAAVHSRIADADTARIETSSGTDLELDIVDDYYRPSDGLVHEPGAFGNLPAGETFGAPVDASGTLVIDHFPFAPEGTRIEIADNEAVAVEHPSDEESELARAFDRVEGARNVAEFGVGTNPEATLIGNMLQDEKVLGTVHIAFGDNSVMVPAGDDRRVEAEVHWDAVCEEPTVWFDGEKVLDRGEPLFR